MLKHNDGSAKIKFHNGLSSIVVHLEYKMQPVYNIIAFALKYGLGMPGLSEGMFCDLSLFDWLIRFTMFCSAHIFDPDIGCAELLAATGIYCAWI
jgi:hypothetical protein